MTKIAPVILLLLARIALPEPVTALGVKGGRVTVNGRPTFLVGQMTARASGYSDAEIVKILDTMMTPYGMNLWVGDFGIIDWGAWNERVNVQRGVEKDVSVHEYPWRRTGPGETLFGGPRFDLDQLDDDYFQRLHERLRLLNGKGIVPVVGIFSDHAVNHPLHWRGHPFHPANNVNDLGLPDRKAIPEYFENPKALAYQETYVYALLNALRDVCYILRPFGEAERTPGPYIERWLRLIEQYKESSSGRILVCLSGSSQVLERHAADSAVDLLDVYCYHDGQYDSPEVNVPGGEKGLRATLREVRARYGKPVGKLYHKYGYPYANPASPWADPKTGTDGGGPPTAARDALRAIYREGGFGCFFKMAWRRDRGQYLQPDAWSTEIRDFLSSTEAPE